MIYYVDTANIFTEIDVEVDLVDIFGQAFGDPFVSNQTCFMTQTDPFLIRNETFY